MNDKEGKQHLTLAHVRGKEQEAIYRQILEDGVCPFCPEHFRKYHPNPILWESEWWTVTTNMKPYKGTRLHLLLVLKVHACSLAQLPDEAGLDYFRQIKRAEDEFNIRAGASVMRFGLDFEDCGASGGHLHGHLAVGSSPRSETAQGIRFKVGYYEPESD